MPSETITLRDSLLAGSTVSFETYTIDHINGSTVGNNETALDTLNGIIDQTSYAVNSLAARVASLNSKSAIICHHVPLATGVTAGMLVYYDATPGVAKYKPAVAALLAEPGSQGQSIAAPSCHVEGIVLSVEIVGTETQGTLMRGGYWQSSTVAGACLGENATAGLYYLSPTTPGTAVLDPGSHFRQPVIMYYGNGQFSLGLFYNAHDGHYHRSEILAENGNGVWATPGAGDAPEAPNSYVSWVYLDYGTELGELSNETTAVFYNGELQRTDWLPPEGSTVTKVSFYIKNGYLWSGLLDAPEPGSVVVFNHFPFSYNSPVVRAVESTNDSLTVQNKNGLILLTPNDFVSGSSSKNSFALSTIMGNKLIYTPVLTDAIAGPGINISKALDGTAYISEASKVGELLDAYSINHNGTTVESSGAIQKIVFPKGRASELIMYFPITGVNTPCKIFVWGMKMGTAAAALYTEAYFIEDPGTGTSVIPNTTAGASPAQINWRSAANENNLVYSELDTGITITGNGMLMARISTNNEVLGTAVSLFRLGFKLHAVADVTIAEDYVNNAITANMVAGDAVEAGYAVMVSANRLYVCTNTRVDTDNTNKCVGVAVKSAEANVVTTYMITGIMTYTAKVWRPTGSLDPEQIAAPGSSLYVGLDGKMVAVNDSDLQTFMQVSRFLQKVGTVLTPSLVQIGVESAVRGAE